jgi:putative ABC transport system permease protein
MIVDDALALSGAENVSQITVLAKNPDAVNATAKDISAEIKAAHGGAEDFSVTTQEQLLSSFTQITNVLTIGLTGIAAISLLVGGIGVMNIMLVSVTERTREIGVRKALGARKRDILLQFLIESLTLCLIGGAVGILLGAAAAVTLAKVLSWNTLISPASVVIAFGFSALVGLFFGIYPARRAASLDPIEALRYE